MKSKGMKRGLVILAITLIILWVTGVIGLWMNGIAYIANKTDYINKGYMLKEEFTVSIDLNNLESNEGRDIYNDGVHRIYVDRVIVGDSGYIVGFRSSGKYSLKEATLVSGINHYYEGGYYYSEMQANMTADYNNKRYNSSRAGTGGLNYKDGDGFGFYLFPHEAYEKGEISKTEKGIVQLTITDLYKNHWIKN